MSGPCTDCGGPDYQTLEAENATVIKRAADAIIQQEQRAEQAEAELAVQRELRRTDNAAGAKLNAELHEALRVVYEEGWPGTENENPWPLNDPEHLEAPEYERAMTPDEFLADLRARAEEGSET